MGPLVQKLTPGFMGDPAQLIGSLSWPGLGWTFAILCRGGCLAQAVEVWAFGARPRFPLQPPQG